MTTTAPLLEVRNLQMHFSARQGWLGHEVTGVKAVDDVSFTLEGGKTLGLVGESGSGKTTIGKCVVRLLEPTGGEILFEGSNIAHLSRKEMQGKRSEVQMIYQSPAASLNSRMTIGQIVSEPLWIHEGRRLHQARSRVMELLQTVGLKEEHYHRYPHEFSGGQQQRVGIARALALNPRLLVLDEPTSALDVSVQAQVLNLLQALQDQFQLTYLFISHDLGVVRYVCNQVALLYLGKIVEVGEVETIFERPKHPYTQALISAIPEPDPDEEREQIILKGETASANPERGCPFAPRCPAAKLAQCEQLEPELVSLEDGHRVACHLFPRAERG
ncbi:MAG: oligopeptide/dipeptide ABC transporter ATP-binding protein [SAR324 cluster bacterium]|nr:oligopeptide/dipeptide ABC transporter ATP-binding protein [SAR324 cluster bacterium]